jgi:hypothetical protein
MIQMLAAAAVIQADPERALAVARDGMPDRSRRMTADDADCSAHAPFRLADAYRLTFPALGASDPVCRRRRTQGVEDALATTDEVCLEPAPQVKRLGWSGIPSHVSADNGPALTLGPKVSAHRAVS